MSVSGPTQFGTPTMQDFTQGQVASMNTSEIQRAGVFDHMLYPAAGIAQISFFAFPQGQGITTALGAVAGTPKTASDTNLQIANSVPSGKAVQVQGIELAFDPGSSAAANTFALALPGSFTAVAANALLEMLNDSYTFYMSGRLVLSMLDKNYVDESPLIQFPPQTGIHIDSAAATNSATTGIALSTVARAVGRPFVFGFAVTLSPAQNFALNLTYPAAVALPSTFNGRVRCRLDGYTARASQ